MPFLMSFALQHESVTIAPIENASVQFPLNIYATKGFTCAVRDVMRTEVRAPFGSGCAGLCRLPY